MFAEPCAMTREPPLRLVAHTEKCFPALGSPARGGNFEHFSGVQSPRQRAASTLREPAIGACIATQIRERDEDLSRVCDPIPGSTRTNLTGSPEKRVLLLPLRLNQTQGLRLLAIQTSF